MNATKEQKAYVRSLKGWNRVAGQSFLLAWCQGRDVSPEGLAHARIWKRIQKLGQSATECSYWTSKHLGRLLAALEKMLVRHPTHNPGIGAILGMRFERVWTRRGHQAGLVK